MAKVADLNKESDKLSSLGSSAVYRAERLRLAIKEEMAIEGVKEAVMDYIFDGNPDSVSPLAEVRKENK